MFNVGRSVSDLLLWSIVSFTLAAIYVVTLSDGGYPDYLFAFFSFMTCTISIIGLALSQRAGIATSVNTFAILFLSAIPLLSRNYGTTYWGESVSIFQQYPFASFLSASCILAFNIAYHGTFNEQGSTNSERAECNKVVHDVRLVAIAWFAFLIIAAMNNFSLISILVRGGELDQTVDLGSSVASLIVGITFYSMPGVCFVLYMAAGARRRLTVVLLLIPLLIGNAPTGMARFHAAAIYIAVAVTLSSRLRRSSILLPATLILGILVAFPTLNQFRNYEGGVPSIYVIGTDELSAGHFDSFQSVAGSLNMPVTMGRQLLGVFLFWVPRTFWPDKPVGSGVEYADFANLSFTNISMNFFAEGVLNFGALGAVVFALIGGLIAAKIDFNGASGSSLFWVVFSRIVVGMAFFMMRGDLLSSFSFSVGMAVAVYLVIICSTSNTAPSANQPR